MAAPTTRLLSWEQMVREADGPEYTRLSLRPWTYEFSNRRKFVDPWPLYRVSPSFDLMLETAGGTLVMEDGTTNLVQEDAPNA